MQLAAPHMIPNGEVFEIEFNFLATHSMKIATFMSRKQNCLDFGAEMMEHLL